MATKLYRNLSTLALATISSIFALATSAQEPEPVEIIVLPEAFNRAFMDESGDFFENRSLGRQVDWMFGPGSNFGGSFPENEITRDGKTVYQLYLYTLEQQVSSDPIIRTLDLPNPFNSSLRSESAYPSSLFVPRSDFIFEIQP
ncbi:MAG: hypothetical protein F6K24_01225 [Okeania sp. SIO2D1]|nr:hypothetical protein [Okeania sp. SIO2D1]